MAGLRIQEAAADVAPTRILGQRPSSRRALATMITAGARVGRQPLLAGRHGWGGIEGHAARLGVGIAIPCVAVGAGISLALPEEANTKGALLGAFVVCAVAALGPILILGRGAAREPIVYYPIIAFADLAGSSLAWLGEPESPISLSRADVTKALLLVATGFAALWVGWFATRGRRAAHPRAGLIPSELPSRRLTIALAVVGFASLLLLVATGYFGFLPDFERGGPLGPWTGWVVAADSALDVALAFAAFRAFGTSDRARAWPDFYLLTVLLIVEFGAGLLHGTKVFILPRLLVVVFIYALFHHRMPLKWGFVLVIAMALAFPIVEQYRALSSQPDVETGAVGLVIGGVDATIQDPHGSAGLALDKLNRRTRQIENVAAILRDTPSVFPHTRGNELPKALAMAFVPRLLWPDKPALDSATMFARLYLKQATSTRSGTGPSHFGDLYRSFALPGVILGMGLFGAAFGALGRMTERGGIRALLIIAFILTVVTRVEDSLAEVIVSFVHIMAPVFLAAILLPRSRSAITGARNQAGIS